MKNGKCHIWRVNGLYHVINPETKKEFVSVSFWECWLCGMGYGTDNAAELRYNNERRN